jgi:uncharacterized membrane protein
MKKLTSNLTDEQLITTQEIIRFITENAVSISDASVMFNLSPVTLRKRAASGHPGYFKIGKMWFVLRPNAKYTLSKS